MSYIKNKLDEIVEILAEKEHDRWAHWQKYMHERVYDSYESINPHLKVIPTEDFNRWERQIKTQYSELSEKEKESDRNQVRKYLPIIEQALTDYHNHIVEEVNKKVDLDDRGGEYLMGYNSAISDVQQFLQDTNPKE
jgi:hypothetical protein